VNQVVPIFCKDLPDGIPSIQVSGHGLKHLGIFIPKFNKSNCGPLLPICPLSF
jgi:hypothetical protein